MARVWQSGFEQNTSANNFEFSSTTNVSIQTATVRSGAYAGRFTSFVSGVQRSVVFQFTAASTAAAFSRCYLNVAALPSAENRIIALQGSTTVGSNVRVYITIDNTGVLRLYDSVGVIGSPSAALSTGTWYMIEIHYDSSGAGATDIVRARLDGVEFAGASNRNNGNISTFVVGGNLGSEANTAGDFFFDDMAINDATGSFQNTYPGEGKIIHLRPNAAGDVNTFATQTGGTAGAANNYTRVNEIAPDSATTFNGSSVLNEEDMLNVDDSGIGVSDAVNAVLVGFNFRNNVSDATTAVRIRLKKVTGGTVVESVDITRNNVSFVNNGSAAPRNYPIVTHKDPDNANWSQNTLNTMQIGYKLTVANVNRIDVTAVWASVDYTPAAGATGQPYQTRLRGSTEPTGARRIGRAW